MYNLNRPDLQAPYYAVIFTYKRSTNLEGYPEMDELTLKLAQEMPGFLGYEYTGDGAEHAIFISYWKDMESIKNWGQEKNHIEAKSKGKTQWYQWYHSQICKVERSSFNSLD